MTPEANLAGAVQSFLNGDFATIELAAAAYSVNANDMKQMLGIPL